MAIQCAAGHVSRISALMASRIAPPSLHLNGSEDEPWTVVRNSPRQSSSSNGGGGLQAGGCGSSHCSSSWDIVKAQSPLPSSASFGSRNQARLRDAAQLDVGTDDEGRSENGVPRSGCSSGHPEPPLFPDDGPEVSSGARIDWYPVGSMELDAVLAQEIGVQFPIGSRRTTHYRPAMPAVPEMMSLGAFLEEDVPSFPQPKAPFVPSAQ
jgi:hypothetical protein